MEIKYITDTDFLPDELTQYHDSNNCEMTNDLYQIVFGILQASNDLNHVYDLVIRVAHREKNDTIRKFKLQELKKSLESILKVLTKFKSKENEVVVYIPYTECEISMSAAESYFKMAVFTIGELLDGKAIPEPLFPNETLVPDIKSLFMKSYESIYESLDEGKPGSGGLLERTQYNHLIIQDEMYRRGITHIFDKKRGKHIDILPSQYYDDDKLYKRIFVDNGLKNQQDNESNMIPTPNATEGSSLYDNDNIETRAKVIYYMLDSICPLTEDNFNKYVALIDFAVGKQPRKFHINRANDVEINKENNKSTIKRYVRNCMSDPDYLKKPYSDRVREKLIMQGFEVPEVGNGKSQDE